MSTTPANDRRSFRLLAWAALPVLGLAGTVQVTGVGIDILVLAMAALILFTLERSVGDLLGEWFGPIASALILILVGGALVWYFLADAKGRSQTDQFFVQAEQRGYRTVYYQTARSSADTPQASHDSRRVAQPVDAQGTAANSPNSAAASLASGGDHAGNGDAGAQGPAATPAASPGRPGRETGITRSFRSLIRRVSPGERLATSLSLEVSPPRVEVARRAVISATVTGDGTPVTAGTVEFMVNGMGAGRVLLNSDGVASTTYITYIAGSYEVHARYSGSTEYAGSAGRAGLNVVGRR